MNQDIKNLRGDAIKVIEQSIKNQNNPLLNVNNMFGKLESLLSVGDNIGKKKKISMAGKMAKSFKLGKGGSQIIKNGLGKAVLLLKSAKGNTQLKIDNIDKLLLQSTLLNTTDEKDLSSLNDITEALKTSKSMNVEMIGFLNNIASIIEKSKNSKEETNIANLSKFLEESASDALNKIKNYQEKSTELLKKIS